eukprot:5388526-Pyramimonas_sp.AAC.1
MGVVIYRKRARANRGVHPSSDGDVPLIQPPPPGGYAALEDAKRENSKALVATQPQLIKTQSIATGSGSYV